jgi:hypothetical protein
MIILILCKLSKYINWEGVKMLLMSGVIIALLTSIFTTGLAFWRFRSEKWWELKVSTYMKILESLHSIKKNFDDEYTIFKYSDFHDEQGAYEAEEYKKTKSSIEMQKVKFDLKNAEKLAFGEIEKCIDIGSFVIKDDAVICLKKLISVYGSSNEYEELEDLYSRDEKAIRDCILEIKSIAENDVATICVYLRKKSVEIKNILKKRCIKK